MKKCRAGEVGKIAFSSSLLGTNSAHSHCNSEGRGWYAVGIHYTLASTNTVSSLIGEANHSVPIVPDACYC